MKRFITCAMVFLMIVALSVPAFAANRNQTNQSIAYLTIDANTTAAQEAQILEARKEIIYSHSWVADGLSGRIVDRDGNVKEILPQFSDVFPQDWELPIEYGDPTVVSSAPLVIPPEYDINNYFLDTVWLQKATSELAPPFCSFQTTGFPDTEMEYNVETVYTSASYGNWSDTAYCNIGYTNVETGQSLGFKENMENGDSFELDPPTNIVLGVRASTYFYPGEWDIRVDGKRVFTYGS